MHHVFSVDFFDMYFDSSFCFKSLSATMQICFDHEKWRRNFTISLRNPSWECKFQEPNYLLLFQTEVDKSLYFQKIRLKCYYNLLHDWRSFHIPYKWHHFSFLLCSPTLIFPDKRFKTFFKETHNYNILQIWLSCFRHVLLLAHHYFKSIIYVNILLTSAERVARVISCF